MHPIVRQASVKWTAGAHGASAVTTDGGALAGVPFASGRGRHRSANTRLAQLIAAAHAGSFSLALADELGQTTEGGGEILISATVTLQHFVARWTITNIHLNVIARTPRLSQGKFIDATLRAKAKCLVTRALRPIVSMNAKLEKSAPRRSAPIRSATTPARLRRAGSRTPAVRTVLRRR